MADPQTLEAPAIVPGRPTRRTRRLAVVFVVASLVGGVAVSANAWLRGGTHLNIPGGYGYGLPGLAVGKSVTFGVPMETSGGPNVVVKSAAADYPSNVTVRSSIIHTEPGAPGSCTPVSGPDLGARWLVVTGALLRPGPWSVSHITVNYSSWWRDRTATEP